MAVKFTEPLPAFKRMFPDDAASTSYLEAIRCRAPALTAGTGMERAHTPTYAALCEGEGSSWHYWWARCVITG